MKLAVSQQLINTAHRMCSAGPPDRPPKPKGTEELQALQQRYNHSSSHLHTMSYGVSRPKMLKSRSQVRRWVSFSYWVEGFCDVCVCVHACLCTWGIIYTTAWLVPFPLFTLPSFLPPSLQGDSIDTDGKVTVPSASYVRPPRVHQYEEIKPKLVYADLDLDLGKHAKSRTAK